MNWKKLFCNILLALPLCAMLAACGAASNQESDSGVQDIQPGDKSIIDSPAPEKNKSSNLEERAI